MILNFDNTYKKLLTGNTLSPKEFNIIFKNLISLELCDTKKVAILTALSVRKESIEEISEGVKILREISQDSPNGEGAIDIVGTGGDGLNTINISTASAFIVSAAGGKVIKHGNKSATSKSGSSDFLEALGINLDKIKERNFDIYKETDLTFLYAPHYHPTLKNVAHIRKELGVKSIFNILGPLANPSSPDYMLLGVYSEELLDKMADILIKIGVKKAMVVHGVKNGCDEVSICGPTKVVEINRDKKIHYTISPLDFGLDIYNIEDIKGGSAKDNAKFIREVFSGENMGAMKSALIINSGVALYINGICDSIKLGVELATETIENKKALAKLIEYLEVIK